MSPSPYPCAVSTCGYRRRPGDVFCCQHSPRVHVETDTAFYRAWRRQEAREQARRLLRGRRARV